MPLFKYIIKKLVLLIPVLIGISIIAFALGVMSPGDPVDQVLNPSGYDTYTQEEYDAMAKRMGLDQPVTVQYFNWLEGILQGDLGRSFFTQKSILEQLQRRIPISLTLAACSMVLITIFGVGFGLLMAFWKDRAGDHILSTVSTVALSVPSFWIAIILIFIFAENLKLLPTSGLTSPIGYLLPAITLAIPGTGVCARLTRSAILDEAGRQYVLVADSKGLKKRTTLTSHIFRNALIPIVTWLGTHAAGILGGAAIIETVFALPGIGSYAISAVLSKDYYVIQAYVLFCGCVYVLVNILIDLLYLALNPKIRTGETAE